MKTWIGCLVGAMVLLLFSCQSGKKAEEVAVDLPQILEKKELVVLTVNSSVSYFNYRGEPMGFQYELAQQFAKSLGVTLKVKVVKDEEGLVDSLLSGAGDLVAYNLIMTNSLKDSLIYCGEEDITRQVIVQRRGKKVLKDVTELVGKKVYVNSGKYRTRLENLNRELGGGIDICEVSSDSVSSEDLITWVAEGRIDYTVATDEIAKINRTYYPVLDIGLAISFDQRSSWAVRKTSPQLAAAADKWHRENINSPEFRASARRYFELAKRPSHGSILSVKDGKISHYDALFRRYAKEIGWDWRLLASLAYTESNFNPNVVSWAGAKGLMQLMPATSRVMGVPPGKEQDPEESIKAAVKYIGQMQRTFSKVTDKEEQAKFILAAYNCGVGHVTDAMALAEKYGRNRYLWEHHVAHYMLLKSNKEYYQDPVCKNGYLRGSDTYEFVREILARTELYKRKIKK
ncbi:transglycosylase SLT domain-containing protein [Bacteroides mediterraneensis]|uniref:transglycosylase SLT domain-containing protein n=1 Tax=Bacteroides mediterraneensis TaxID=1841856 RepID=UPI0026F1ED25|nr:transglycosylase SLT domain-containing protein [Bacteroides mediterraneensis]